MNKTVLLLESCSPVEKDEHRMQIKARQDQSDEGADVYLTLLSAQEWNV